jgi:predicted  nucleic acid-binding Zn-ribbon protein
MCIHLKVARPAFLLLLVSVLTGGPLANPADAVAQDVRELQRRLELTEAKVAEEARSTEVRLAEAHRQIAALEEERQGLRRELGEHSRP